MALPDQGASVPVANAHLLCEASKVDSGRRQVLSTACHEGNMEDFIERFKLCVCMQAYFALTEALNENWMSE